MARDNRVRVAILGDYRPDDVHHRATNDALDLAGQRLGIHVDYEWVLTDSLPGRAAEALDGFDGVWVSPGSPYRSFEGALEGIQSARENGTPLVGT